MQQTVFWPPTVPPLNRQYRGIDLLRFLARKIWLPRAVYAILPVVYLLLGSYALATGLALRPGSALLPLVQTIALLCFYTSIGTLYRRFRRSPPSPAL